MTTVPHWFKNYEEVEFVLGYTFTPEQKELVSIYLFTGIRPDNDGCWVCTKGYIRKITGEIDAYETLLDNGEATWPWERTVQ